MKHCSNCGAEALGDDVIHVAHRGRVVAVICSECAGPAAKPRVTLSRASAKDSFAYEQYVCVEILPERY